MPILHISVADKIAAFVKRDGAIVCGNSDYKIIFTFDAEWADSPKKTARFIWNGEHIDVTFEGDVCAVPIITGATAVEVGVYAGDLHTTTSAEIPCKLSILCGGTTIRPEATERYKDEALEAAERAEAAAEKIEEAIIYDPETMALSFAKSEAYGGASFASGGSNVAGISLAKYKELFAEALAGKTEEEVAQLYAEACERDTVLDGKTFDTIGFKYWFATAMGEQNEALGRSSYAEGYGNTVMNDFAHAEGYANIVRGVGGHAEGNHNEVDGAYAHVVGEQNIAHSTARASQVNGYGNKVSAMYADVGGRANTVADGAEGAFVRGGWNNVTAKAKYCHVEGQFNEADATMVYVGGINNKAKHTRVHIEGQNHESAAANQYIIGKYSKSSVSAAFIVGNGDATTPSNAYELDWSGNATFAGKVSCKDPTLATHAATKGYVDALLGDVEGALDELHAYAQSIVTGGAGE